MGNIFTSKVFKGTLVLTIFGFLGKALGAVFKIGLTRLVGSLGMGIYQLVFPVLVFFIVFSSEGFSLALTVKTAEDKTYAKHSSYFKLAVIISLIFACFSGLFVCIFANFLARIQGGRVSALVYYVVAVGIVIISLLSIIKAKIRGEERFRLYSIAEVVEDLLKVVFGLALAKYLLRYGIEMAVAGVIAGLVLSSLLTIIFLLCVKDKNNKFANSMPLTPLEKKNYLKFAFVSLLSALVVPTIQFVESAIIVCLLERGGASSINATKLFGLSRGSVSALINLPFFLLASFEVLLLPNLARAKNGGVYYKKTEISLFLAFFVSLPFVFLFVLFAPAIMQMVYGGSFTATELEIGANLLRLGAVGVVFSSISTILVVILNSNNKAVAPLLASLIAGVIKIVFLVIFVPRISIYGAELSSILFSMVVCLVNLIFAVWGKMFTRPKNIVLLVICLSIVFGTIYLVYLQLLKVFSSIVLACVCSICAVGAVGLILLAILCLIFKDKVIKLVKNMTGSE